MARLGQSLRMHSGDSKTLDVTVKNTAGAVVDLTSFTATWEASVLNADGSFAASPSITKSTVSGITITDAEGGELQIVLQPSDTDSLTGDFYHELELTSGGGVISTVMTGKLTIDTDLIVP